MLIKVIRGREPGALCRYVLDPKKQQLADRNVIEKTSVVSSVVFCSTMFGRTTEQLTRQLRFMAQLNSRVQRTVAHYSVSLHPDEAQQVTQSQMAAISKAMLDELGHSRCPYFAVEHHDSDQKHWHVVTSTVAYDGSWIDDSFERIRLRVLEEALEHRFLRSLAKAKSARKGRHLSTGEYRRKVRTGEVLPKEKLWSAINDCIEPEISIERFVLNLRAKYPEVSVRFREKDSQKVGISFEIDGIAFSGRKLGRPYSLQGLATHHGITATEASRSALDKILALPVEQCKQVYLDIEREFRQVSRTKDVEIEH